MAQAVMENGVLKLVCEQFAKCTNTTLRASNHPILGPVPTCSRCAARLELDTVEVEVKR